MAFTNKNLHSHKSGMTFLKGATFFFLGMSVVMFMTQAFEVIPSMKNTRQFIQEIIFTENGSSVSSPTVTIDGSGGNASFSGTVTGAVFCLEGDDCITERPEGGTVVGGESIWKTGASNVAYYNLGNVGVKTNTPTEDFQVSSYAKIGSNNFNTGGNFLRIHSTYVPGSSGGPSIPATLAYYKNPNIQLNRKGQVQGDYHNRKIENNGKLKFDYATGSYDYDTKLSLSSAGLMTLDGTGKFDGVCLGSVCKNVWPEAGGESVWMTGASKIYYNSGNVGIGTGNPSEKLHVAGTIKTDKDFFMENSSNNFRFAIGEHVPGSGGIASGHSSMLLLAKDPNGGGGASEHNGNILLNPYNWSAAYGNVGIHTAHPETTLHVAGSGQFDGNVNVNGQFYSMGNAAFNSGIRMDYGSIWADDGEELLFKAKFYRFQTGTIEVGNSLKLKTLGDHGAIYSNNNLLLNVSGTGLAVTIDTSKNMTVVGDVTATAYYYSSDERLKTAISPIISPLQKILSLNGYNFTWIKDGRQDIGIIAQEVEKIFPEIVQTNPEGYKSVEYGNLVAPLIEAIKELNAKIDRQAQEIAILKANIQ